VFVAAAVEALAAELVENAGDAAAARDAEDRKVTVADLKVGVEGDVDGLARFGAVCKRLVDDGTGAVDDDVDDDVSVCTDALSFRSTIVSLFAQMHIERVPTNGFIVCVDALLNAALLQLVAAAVVCRRTVDAAVAADVEKRAGTACASRDDAVGLAALQTALQDGCVTGLARGAVLTAHIEKEATKAA
jgi:hypothetical protein